MPLVAFFAYTVGLLSIVAFLGDWWPWFDLVASFRAHLAVALAIAGGLLLRRRWVKTGAVSILFMVINLAVIAPLFWPPSPQGGSVDLRVMSFNVLSTNANFAETIDYIAEQQPDLVLLHEVSQPWEDALAAAGFDYEITRGRTEGLIFGSLVMAPRGAVVRSYGFARASPRAVEVVLPSGVAVLGIHPLAPFPEAETEARQFQFEFAALWALGQDGPRVVVGDFNAGPWSYPFRRLRATTGLLNSQRGYGLELSYPASAHPVLQVSIDHLLHSPDLAVVDRRLGPPMGSDHLPLVVDLSILEGPEER